MKRGGGREKKTQRERGERDDYIRIHKVTVWMFGCSILHYRWWTKQLERKCWNQGGHYHNGSPVQCILRASVRTRLSTALVQLERGDHTRRGDKKYLDLFTLKELWSTKTRSLFLMSLFTKGKKSSAYWIKRKWLSADGAQCGLLLQGSKVSYTLQSFNVEKKNKLLNKGLLYIFEIIKYRYRYVCILYRRRKKAYIYIKSH